ncbi:MAG: hypothetical protein ABR553_08405 [Gammaproteobacteria bacterium]
MRGRTEMAIEAVCWKCGTALDPDRLPPARLAECPACRAELHVCRACVFYDPRVAGHCREPIAEVVADKTRANFCGYFQLRPDAHTPEAAEAAEAARKALEDMFKR